jgi:hypothetical protein
MHVYISTPGTSLNAAALARFCGFLSFFQLNSGKCRFRRSFKCEDIAITVHDIEVLGGVEL